MKIREIMTTDVATAAPDTTLDEVAIMMRDEDTGAIPVVDDNERLIGIVTDRDIVIRCIAEGKDPSDIKVEDVISEDLHTISPEADSEEAARLMSQRQIRRLPVVQNEELIGIISLGDIAVKDEEDVAGETLEEVSQGVKQRGKMSAGRQASGQDQQRIARTSGTHRANERDLEDMEEESVSLVSSADESDDYDRNRNEDRELRMENQQGASRSGRTTSTSKGRASATIRGGETESIRGSKVKPIRQSGQGIANRDIKKEQGRQSKVAPSRASSGSGRRKAS